MRELVVVLMVLVGLLVPSAPASATGLPSAFVEETLTDGALTAPNAVTFAPDGRMFVAEKRGRVRVVLADGTVASTPLLDLRAKVNSASDRGLLVSRVLSDLAVGI